MDPHLKFWLGFMFGLLDPTITHIIDYFNEIPRQNVALKEL